ncbi:MAG: RNA polymerase sigma factor [Bacteroidaceae bacterium]|nr:RNA polymerase sigma factor [Bacteroidaceae bacterium]MCF0199425.1 RNA polymerase sigma factor [Bacteroidaceae bacterium]
MKELNFQADLLPLKDKLFRLAWRITLDRAEAEDIVQDTLIRVWTQREEWSAINNPEAYCLTICRNMALDRSQSAVASNLSIDAQQDVPVASFVEVVQQRERLQLVREQMDRLPEIQRTIMELRDMQGHNYQEIADMLHLSESQVKVYLHRARQKVKSQVEKIENYGL